jgi:hypothetical protein
MFVGGAPLDGLLLMFVMPALVVVLLPWVIGRIRWRPTTTKPVSLGPMGGGDEPAVVLPYSRAQFALIVGVVAWLLVAASIGVVWSMAALVDTGPAGAVLVGVPSVVGVIWALVALADLARGTVVRGYLALSPAGIEHRSWGLISVLDWRHVASVEAADDNTPVIEVRGMANADGGSRRTSWWLRQPLPTAADLVVPARHLAVDPAIAYHALQFYLAHPATRAELGSELGVERLRRLDLPVAPEKSWSSWMLRAGDDHGPSRTS